MVDIGESSSSNTDPSNAKPVIVRVKRKSSQSPLEALWLEISERPLKRRLLDFGKLSISDSPKKEECKTKKILVQHVETVSSSEATIDVLQFFVPNSSDASELKAKVEERRQAFKQDDKKQDRLLSKARQKHEVLAKNARFEQIWKHRKGNKDKMHDDSLLEICHLYDVVRVDPDEERYEMMKEPEDTSLEDNAILCNYMPLIREFLPSVAAEIQSDMHSYISRGASSEDYVYDLYTMQEGELKTTNEDDVNTYPLVQVEDDEDYYDGPTQSEYESDDSNAEDNPLNEYPDEEISEDDDHESRTSHDESEELESKSSGDESGKLVNKRDISLSEGEETLYEDEDIDDYHVEDNDNDDGDENWKWRRC